MVFLNSTPCICRSVSICRTTVRFLRSGYRLKPDLSPGKYNPNLTDEQKYQDKIYQAMLHKRKSPLRGFDRVSVAAYKLSKDYKPLPNERFYGRDDLPTYGSYKNYVKEAERARRNLRKKEVFWKTAHFWGKKESNEPEYVDIGLPLPSHKLSRKEVKALKKEQAAIKSDPEMERAARKRTLKVDVDSLLDEWEGSGKGVSDIHSIAMHHGIYKDLFGDGHFYPIVRMNVDYEAADDNVSPVYYGNDLTPSETSVPPLVNIDSSDDDLWSLVLTSLDGNIEDQSAEYIHWFVGNIKGNDISNGETLVDYLRPLPPRGLGYLRMVFLLFKQNKIIDFSEEKRELPCLLLRERSFRSKALTDKFKGDLIPVSLRFFQTKWDPTVQETFHHVLNMPEPVYKFTQPPFRKGPLKKYPHKKTPEWLRRFMPDEPIYPGGGKFT